MNELKTNEFYIEGEGVFRFYSSKWPYDVNWENQEVYQRPWIDRRLEYCNSCMNCCHCSTKWSRVGHSEAVRINELYCAIFEAWIELEDETKR